MSFVPLFLQAADPAQPQQGSLLMSVLPFILIIAIFYFFIIRPQNKKQKETEKMINALKKGDKVVTIGGIHGVVTSTKEKTVIVKVDSNTTVEFNRSAIATVIADKKVEAKAEKKAKKSEENASKAEKTVETPSAESENAVEVSAPESEKPAEEPAEKI